MPAALRSHGRASWLAALALLAWLPAAAQESVSFPDGLRNLPVVLGTPATATIRAATTTGDGSITYSLVNPPSWIDSSDIGNRILELNPTAAGQVGRHTVTVRAAAGSASVDKEFNVDVMMSLTLSRSGDKRAWRFTGNVYKEFFVTSDFCRVRARANPSVSRIRVTSARNGKSVDKNLYLSHCTGNYIGYRSSLGRIWHVLKDDEHELILDYVPAGTYSVTITFEYYSEAYQTRFAGVFHRQEFRTLHQYTEVTVTIADVAGSQLPAGYKLATVTFAHQIPNVDWEFHEPPQPDATVTPVAGTTNQGVVALVGALAADPADHIRMTLSVSAYSSNDVSPLVQGRSDLVVVKPRFPPKFSSTFADRQHINDAQVQFTFPEATDEQGDELTYSATLEDGSALPSDIDFDAATRVFTIAAGISAGAYRIRVRASESADATSYDEQVFELQMSNAPSDDITVDTSSLGVLANARLSAAVPVQLSALPDGGSNVTVTITSLSDDLAATPSTMVFTPTDWNSAQQLNLALTESGRKIKSSRSQTVQVEVHGRSTSAENYRGAAVVPIAVSISIANLAPVFAADRRTRSIDEKHGKERYPRETPIGAPVDATDADNPDGLVYRIRPTSAFFSVDSDSGQIRTRSERNYNHESAASYLITVEVHDNEPAAIRQSATVTVQINVNDIVETPDTYTAYGLVASHRTGRSMRLSWNNNEYWAQFYRSDSRPVLLSYETGGNPAVEMQIDRYARMVTATISGLAENTAYTVSLGWQTADDQSSWSSRHVFSTGFNRAPAFPPESRHIRVNENFGREEHAAGSRITELNIRGRLPWTKLEASDEDGDDISYSLVGSSDIFSIDPATGHLSVLQTINFNHEAGIEYLITVQAADDFSPPATSRVTVSIEIGDVMEEPELIYRNGNFRVLGASPTRITLAWSNDDYHAQFDSPDRASIVVIYQGGNEQEEGRDSTFGSHVGTMVLEPDQEGITLTGMREETRYVLRIGWFTQDNHVGGASNAVQGIYFTTVANTDPAFVASSLTPNRDENVLGAETPLGTAVGTLSVTDAESTAAVSYSFRAGGDAGAFGLDAASGVITLAAATNLDREGKASYTVNVQADDGDGGSATGEFVLSIDGVDEPPVFERTLADQRVRTTGDEIALPAASDPESETITHAVALADGTALSSSATPGVTYDSVRHVLVIAAGADEGSYRIRITATESGAGGLTADQVFALNVVFDGIKADASGLAAFTPGNRVQSLPVALGSAPIGQPVTVAVTSATAAHMTATPAQLVFDADDWSSPKNVELRLVDAGAAVKGIRSIQIDLAVHDPSTSASNYRDVVATAVQAAVIVPSASPVFAASQRSKTQVEHVGTAKAAIGLTVSTPVVAEDADNDDATELTYSINPASDLFKIVPGTGQLQHKVATTNFNHEAAVNSYTVTVEVHDNDVEAIRGHATVTVVIGITDDPVEQPDPYTMHDFKSTSHSRHQIVLAWSNDEYERQFAAVDRASLQISHETGDGPAVTKDLAAGSESHTIIGLSDNTAYTLSLRWKSSGSGLRWSPVVTVTTDANRVPEFRAGSLTGNVDENAPVADTDLLGTLEADDDDGDGLTYSKGGGGDSGLFNVQADGKVYLLADRTFDYETKAAYTIAVAASDGISVTTAQFVFSINPMDEPPAFPGNGELDDQMRSNRGSGSFTIPPATDPEGETITYEAVEEGDTDLPTGVTFSGRTFSIGASAVPGTYSIEVTATEADRSGESNLPANESRMSIKRVFSLEIVEDGIMVDSSGLDAGGLGKANRFDVLAVELLTMPAGGRDVTLDITSSAAGDVAVHPDQMVFTPTGWNTAQDLTVSLTEAGTMLKGDRSVNIGLAVNDAPNSASNYRNVPAETVAVAVSVPNASPVFDADDDAKRRRSIDENVDGQTTAQGTGIGDPFTATDADDDPGELAYALVGTSALFGVDAASGLITLLADTAFDHETVAGYTVTVGVEDDEAAAIRGRAQVTVAITVVDVNEGPVFASLVDQAVIEGVGGSYQFPAASDPDLSDEVSYAASTAAGGALPAGVEFDDENLRFTFAASLDFQEVTLQVVASDRSGERVQRRFVLRVKDAGGVVLQPQQPDMDSPPPPDQQRTLPALARTGRHSVFELRLDVQPQSAAVTLTLASQDAADVSVMPVTMQFDRSNWNVPQPATLSLSDSGAGMLTDRVVSLSIGVHGQSASDAFYRGSRSLMVAVQVANENAVPDFGGDRQAFFIDAARVEEVAAAGVIGTVTATDGDADTVTYSIAPGDDAAIFEIDAASGQIGFAAALSEQRIVELLAAGNSYEFTVEGADGFGGVGRLQVQVRVPAPQEDKVVLAAVDSAIAFAASDMIQARLAGSDSPEPDAAAGLQQEGARQPDWMDAADEQWRAWRGDGLHAGDSERIEQMHWRDFLYGGGFDLALAEAGVRGPRLRMWGRASRVSLTGNPLADGVRTPYDGNVNVFMLGVEAGRNGRKLGIAAGRSKGRFVVGDSGTRVRRQLNSVHPYASFRLSDRLRLWAAGGFGAGEYVRAGSDGRAAAGDTRYISAAGGLRTSFVHEGMEIAGGFQGLQVQSKLEAADRLPAASARAWRVQADFEAGRSYSIGPEVVFKPFAGVDIRYDGGNGPFDYGQALDATAGMNLNWRQVLSARISSRLQVQGGDSRERRIDGSISYDRGSDGRGLMLAASPKAASVDDAPFEGGLSVRVGYGLPLRLFGESGLAVGSADLSNAGAGSSYGLKFSGRRLGLDLSAAGDGAYRMDLRLR